MADYPRFRCCDHCEHNDEGVCTDAPSGTDSHVVVCRSGGVPCTSGGDEQVEE